MSGLDVADGLPTGGGQVTLGCPLLAQSGHRLVQCKCLLLTQSGHRPFLSAREGCYDLLSKPRGCNEAARFHFVNWKRCGHMAASGARSGLLFR